MSKKKYFGICAVCDKPTRKITGVVRGLIVTTVYQRPIVVFPCYRCVRERHLNIKQGRT